MSSGLVLKNIGKEFPGVRALQGVTLSFTKGTVHAVVGANGAGKSTLLKILSGVYSSYDGRINCENTSVAFHHPLDAKKNGIHTVYQEVDQSLVGYFSVAENILLDRLREEKSLFINWRKIQKIATIPLRTLDLSKSIPLHVPVSTLSLHSKQIILIARALIHNVRFLLLDEPTAPLSRNEIKTLYRIVRHLVKNGVGVIFISHRISEIFELCDRVTVLRDGKLVGTETISDITEPQIIEMMFGKTYIPYRGERKPIGKKEVIRVDHVSIPQKLNNISFNVFSGEIFGIVGMTGAGKSELARALFGAETIQKGSIFMHGKKILNANPAQAVSHRIAHVPEERRRDGLLLQESVKLNCMLSQRRFLNFLGFIQRKKEISATKESIHNLGIVTPSYREHTEKLSGGNQQKVVIARWLQTEAEVFLFDEPTKGVDIGAKQELFRLISNLANSGKTILYFSCEVEEVLALSHRVCMMHSGSIVKIADIDSLTIDDVYTAITG